MTLYSRLAAAVVLTIVCVGCGGSRYSSETLHGDAPLKYFAEPLRSSLHAFVFDNYDPSSIRVSIGGTLAGEILSAAAFTAAARDYVR